MLTCQELTELITDYLEGRMPLRDRARMRFHLLYCRGCRAYLRQMRLTIRSLGALSTAQSLASPPPELPPELIARFRNWKR